MKNCERNERKDAANEEREALRTGSSFATHPVGIKTMGNLRKMMNCTATGNAAQLRMRARCGMMMMMMEEDYSVDDGCSTGSRISTAIRDISGIECGFRVAGVFIKIITYCFDRLFEILSNC